MPRLKETDLRPLAYTIALALTGLLFAGTLLLSFSLLAAGGGGPGASTPGGGALTVHARDFGFEPAQPDVAAPGTYAITLVNDGTVHHDITFADGTVISALPGASATGNVVIPTGGTTFICSIPGHAEAGMTGSVTVGGVPVASHPHEMSAEEMRDVDAAVTAQFPAETAGRGNVVLEPTILDDGTKAWELTASVFDWEVEPGTLVEAWGYNQMVPGPQLRAQLGDRVRITLHNELPAPTTLHFHGLLVPNDMDGVPVISQPAVMPGELFVYEFTLRNAGSHMYHSHFMANRQVPLGLLGAFIVSDPDDPAEPDVDLDYTMVLNDGPLGFTLNGKGFPATEPIVASLGQLIRVRYMNEGLQIHPMHLHGIPQLVVAKDGYWLPDPHYEDTVLVAPGERVDVLIEASELGAWAFHCHILTHVESDEGMFGMVTALIVQEP